MPFRKDSYTRRFRPTEVVDGDTFYGHIVLGFGPVLEDQKIRLSACDTYETRRRAYWTKGLSMVEIDRHLYLGKQAKVFVEETFSKAEDIQITSLRKPKRGSFGRWICDVWVFIDGEWESLADMLRVHNFVKDS